MTSVCVLACGSSGRGAVFRSSSDVVLSLLSPSSPAIFVSMYAGCPRSLSSLAARRKR